MAISKKWNLITIPLILIMVIGMIIFTVNDSKSSSTSIPKNAKFTELNLEQKYEWLNKEQKSMEATYLQMELSKRIKNQFKFPETVNIKGELSMVTSARIVDAAIGSFFKNGTGSAKNALGLEVPFHWEIKFTIDDDITIDDVSVIQ